MISQLFYCRVPGNIKLDLLKRTKEKIMANSKQRDKDQLFFLLKLAGNMIDSLIDGLGMIDSGSRKRIMELCGKDD